MRFTHAAQHRQTGLLLTLVRPACLCFFLSSGTEIMPLSHGLHGLQPDGFFGRLVGVLLSSNVLIAVIG